MNIILDKDQFNLNNIFFMDKKKNLIIEGLFSKILLSTKGFTMNCIYLKLPIDNIKIEKNINKTIYSFNPHSQTNVLTILDISKVEYKLIEMYKKLHNLSKKTSIKLSLQLYSGLLKLYDSKPNNKNTDKDYNFVVKISGIWETQYEIGITYKIIYI